MQRLKKIILRRGLEALYLSGLHRLMQPLVGGVGAILALHHVCPPRSDEFQPNRLLEITPSFLDELIDGIRALDCDIISLDEMYDRFVTGSFERRFVCLTIDDGYRDVLQWAYPRLKKNRVPFALYVATSFPDQLGELWWAALETVIARNSVIAISFDGCEELFECRDVGQKREVYELVYWRLRALETDEQMRDVVRKLCVRHGVDQSSLCREQCMGWNELRELSVDPLVTIGAHTVNHYMLKKLPNEATVRAEIEMSRAKIEAMLGVRSEHFAYPVGDPTSAGPREFQIAADLGFKTAVTTRPGVLFKEHGSHLLALPRFSLNGEYQQYRHIEVLMSGAATAVRNHLRRVDAA